jgi:hypothetical protein
MVCKFQIEGLFEKLLLGAALALMFALIPISPKISVILLEIV